MGKNCFHVLKGLSRVITGCIILSQDLQYDVRLGMKRKELENSQKGKAVLISFLVLGKKTLVVLSLSRNDVHCLLLAPSKYAGFVSLGVTATKVEFLTI